MTLSRAIFSTFLGNVVRRRVFSIEERELAGMMLSAKAAREIAEHKRIDGRSPYLLTVSGKGGWHPDPSKRSVYARKVNVTLFDHLMSVVRGALQFAEMDLGTRVDEEELRRRLSVVAAVAFLHDADKILALPRSEDLKAEHIQSLIDRFGIAAFLESAGVTLDANQVLCLIAQAETGRAGMIRPGVAMPHRSFIHDQTYVRLADRVDGAFLTFGKDAKGRSAVDLVLQELKAYDGLDTDALRRDMRVIELRDPHITMLVDEFQSGLSDACFNLSGTPPLIEIHHDGRFLAIVPQSGSDEMIAAGVDQVLWALGAAPRVTSNARGALDIVDSPADPQTLQQSVSAMRMRDRELMLRVGIDAYVAHADEIDSLLSPYGLAPKPPVPATYPGRLLPLWVGIDVLGQDFIEDHIAILVLAAVLRTPKGEDKKGTLLSFGPKEREAELTPLLSLRSALPTSPSWLDTIDPATRKVLLASVAVGIGRRDTEFPAAALDELIGRWLAGRPALDTIPGHVGINDFIDSSSARFRGAIKDRFSALVGGAVSLADETQDGRCHFTNAPVSRDTKINGKSGLYGLKVSAFSGRSGRPESFSSAKSETLVSPVAEAESRLRQIRADAARPSGVGGGIPTRITSPITAGLFPALTFDRGARIEDYSMSDVLRLKVGDGKINFHDDHGLTRRQRIAVYDQFPARLASSDQEPGQIAFVAMAIQVALRTGRPVHVFRGLPVPRPEFVAFDSLPPTVEMILGGTGLRLEELPAKLTWLRGIEAVAGATGFGPELALRLADPATRFAAACDVLERVGERESVSQTDPSFSTLRRIAEQALHQEPCMTDTDNALVAYGQAMAKVQRARNNADGAGFSEQGIKLALEAVESLGAMGQTARESLVAGVAGSLRDAMARRRHFARAAIRDGLLPDAALTAAAEVFVDKVWLKAFGGSLPPSKQRRVAIAVYRYAFDLESRRRSAAFRNSAVDQPGDADEGIEEAVEPA